MNLFDALANWNKHYEAGQRSNDGSFWGKTTFTIAELDADGNVIVHHQGNEISEQEQYEGKYSNPFQDGVTDVVKSMTQEYINEMNDQANAQAFRDGCSCANIQPDGVDSDGTEIYSGSGWC